MHFMQSIMQQHCIMQHTSAADMPAQQPASQHAIMRAMQQPVPHMPAASMAHMRAMQAMQAAISLGAHMPMLHIYGRCVSGSWGYKTW